jgi:hypothetical protein
MHAPSSCDGFLLITHNIRDQRRISTFLRGGYIPENGFGSWKRRARRNYRQTSIVAPAMQAWGEFGFPTSQRVGIRKNKASLGRMPVRRVKHQTQFYANAGNRQAARDRRRFFRTKFAPHWEGSINNIGLRA